TKKEGDGLLGGWPRLERLLLEAEAFDLGEVASGELGRNVEDGPAGNRCRAVVARLKEGKRGLADLDVHGLLHRGKGPGQRAVNISVEADLDGAVEHLARRLVGALRHAAIAGDLAEQTVERHRGKRHPDHAGDEGRERQGNDAAAGFAVSVLAHAASLDTGMGDIGAEPDHGDHEEQRGHCRERPGDGEGPHALATFLLVLLIGHHEVQSSGIEPWPKPMPCSTRSTANSRNKYKTE